MVHLWETVQDYVICVFRYSECVSLELNIICHTLTKQEEWIKFWQALYVEVLHIPCICNWVFINHQQNTLTRYMEIPILYHSSTCFSPNWTIIRNGGICIYLTSLFCWWLINKTLCSLLYQVLHSHKQRLVHCEVSFVLHFRDSLIV